ncbi:fimbria/pilus outer membrane usher protein [Escherichia coli]|nr:fimbria/pilus outer membrane usher protein [Escherichia coli]
MVSEGGILAHSEGVTLSQELGETIALVKAPGGCRVRNRQYARCCDGLARLYGQDTAKPL